MSPKRYTITVKKQINATPAGIWATWTDPAKYVLVHDSHSAEIDFREDTVLKVKRYLVH